ncbi:MAG: efflux RND transporter periplasmic adaptor subunit [Saprospiraceae bacterium]|nr:efflux RND transporter periplasmic adaptor subunit [Saprospiraceae bacterium]
MKQLIILTGLFMVLLATGCRNKKDTHTNHSTEAVSELYTCPMHPEIIRDKPGSCPICGMVLVKKETEGKKSDEVDLESLLQPADEFVVSSVPVTVIQKMEQHIEIKALGRIAYDTRQVGSISSRISGRIEKLYVRYRYQKISKGEHILDIYSPELMTAQQNLIFLLKNDENNTTFIQAAKEKLLLLGMSNLQLQQVILSGKPLFTIAVNSNYSGHIHEATKESTMNAAPGSMNDILLNTDQLSLKEGMYLQKGQSIFTVYNPAKAWVILDIFGEDQGLIKMGNPVKVTAETDPDNDFKASIDFIEPFYRKGNKTLTVRLYFNNSILKIPIGSQVKAIILGNSNNAFWLPRESVVSLGLDKVVFQKTKSGFKARKINTGIVYNNHIQILNGLAEHDSVAVNAQYLMDSESFIKVKK